MARSLGSSAARGVVVTLAGQGSRVVIQLVGVIVLARILAPADFGLLAMVIVVVGFGELLRDFGLSSAAIQSRELTTPQRANLFWINTVLGAVLTVILFLTAPLIADFYGHAELELIAQALAPVFLINGLSTQFRAHLTRDLLFGRLAVSDVVAQAAALAIALVAALAGAGYGALVLQQLAQAVIALVLLVIVTPWWPGLPRRTGGMSPLLRFGGALFGSQIVTYISRNVDTLVISLRFGPSALGAYDRAFQMLMMPLNQLNAPATRVALPVLSRLRDDPRRFTEFLLTAQTILLIPVVAIFSFAAATGPALVALLLGPQWEQTGVLFQILAIGGVFQAANYATYWVFLARGKAGSLLRYSLVSRPVFIVIVLLGAIGDLYTLAGAYAAGLAYLWIFGLVWSARSAGAPARRMAWNGVRTILAYGFAGVITWGAGELYFSGLPLGLNLVASFAVMVVASAGIAFSIPRLRRDLLALLRVPALVRGRGGGAATVDAETAGVE
ncbi:lipopolysaccharide biosynthesis protein [Agromyces atrinae]|uniref:PST family polysaccharide transporter n=1 Tax=Agromyces atrinae TaxID=592376 RepID=A0A852S5E5_9MICO|nr:lipopolysaccharide biosynthesis protein [Agromyces atrinae]NYD68528.1 PST family polysaccharide transporter [Agromyces atrinae]